MEILQEFTFDTKFNQIQHEFEIYLDNGAGNSDLRRYPINPNSIVNLSIQETLADWFTRGHMTFYYNPEGDGDTANTTGNPQGRTANNASPISIFGFNNSIAQANNYSNKNKFYTFRNDGYDQLRIRIRPILSNSNNLDNTNTTQTLVIQDETFWTLSYLFSIYDVEDIDLPPGAQNAASAGNKCLKIYFWDSWYQKLKTNVLEYSTALSPQANIDGDLIEGKYSNPGVIPTGVAMKEIIDLGLSENPSQENYTSSFTVVDTNLQINYNPTADLGEEWDEGSAQIFYTAPASTTAYESLMYLYDKHLGSDAISKSVGGGPPRGGIKDNKLYDFCLLTKQKGPEATDVGYLTLKSVSSYFQRAGKTQFSPGEYQYEHYFLQGYTSTNETPTKGLRAPVSTTNQEKVDIKTLKYNQISNYRFVDISALTNSDSFCTTPVYSFDFKKRNFNVEFTSNTVRSAKEFISKKYINELYKNSGSDVEKLFLITLDKDKEDKNIRPAFSLHGDDSTIRQSEGLNKLLYVGLFQNACINFRTLGLPYRQPGYFIGIDRTEGVESGPFEDKFYGQWFVIDIKHIFETEIYYNDITAIKIHRFEPLESDFLGTLDN